MRVSMRSSLMNMVSMGMCVGLPVTCARMAGAILAQRESRWFY
jgi:hypothetical protein